MKRIDKIYQFIKTKTSEFTLEELLNNNGLTATQVSEELGILRNNVSMELNQLLRADKIIKVKGRPVLYLEKSELEKVVGHALSAGPIEIQSVDEIISSTKSAKEEENPFDYLIGAEGSLKNQVEQAKAAVLYPPNGLHTLIVGQTGVGKTLFVNMMYSYARYARKLGEDAPFIVFNCADYYNNPQLLLSHIFGHIKGAFTGADSEKPGLVEKANGGILFLDEIHRLPPEGQEMIFYFMDTGVFNKLGETERNRSANVLIVGATTEDPNSYMLKTFIRRIPIIINIPSFEERNISEKIDILKYLLLKEAHRVNKPIKITPEVVKALIGSASYGNVGQLKSNIQLICAKGFLNSINNDEAIELDFKTLPSNIKDGLFSIGNKRKEFEELGEALNSTILVSPEGYKVLLEEDPYEPPFNLYKIIEDKASILRDEGMDEEYINKFITTDINIHLKSFYDKFKNDKVKKDSILKIVDKDIVKFAEEIKQLAQEKLKRRYSDRLVYALSLHFSAFFKRIQGESYIRDGNMDGVIKNNPDEFAFALEIKELIEKRYNLEVPDVEVVYIALLLSSVEEVSEGQVGIIVAAHGNSTASSMVNVATKLLGEGRICAVDMPLEISPKKILDIIVDKVKDIDMGKGVLLLVDMGSLYSFESVIMERTGINIKTVDMVSTAMVIEALRKTNVMDMELTDIYNSIKSFKGYSHEINEEIIHGEKVIVTVCSTGDGTAVKLKELVQDIIYNLTEERIKVIPVGIKNLDNSIEEIQKKHNIIAIVGIKKPKLPIPFIPLEVLIDGRGEQILRDVITNNSITLNERDKNILVEDLCKDSLNQFLTFLNPNKITSVLIDFVSVLENKFSRDFSNTKRISVAIHVGCALERMVIKEGLNYAGEIESIEKDTFELVKECSAIFTQSLNIVLSDDEIAYICDMIN
ncbi:MAG: sigma 54-interacting transcriptional regulator [Bacillota bacterium]|nr:sigma 54-interacting transcriptional regulator [Bacillota bacterium]